MDLKATVKHFVSERNRDRLRIVRDAAIALATTFRSTPPRFPATRQEIADALRDSGVASGDTLLVHSSADALGTAHAVAHGATESGVLAYAISIVAALRDVVGPEGTLVMPTDGLPCGTFHFVRERRVFDWRRTPSRRGLVSEVFRRSSDVRRSLNPWYNVTAQGPLAESLVGEHHLSTPYAMDARSPWFKRAQSNAKVALLGVDYEVNSLIHLPEFMHPEEFPEPVYLERPLKFRYMRTDGAIDEIAIKLHVNRYRSGDPTWFQRRLQERYGIFRESRIGNAPLIVFEAGRLYEAMLAEMREGRTWYDAIYER